MNLGTYLRQDMSWIYVPFVNLTYLSWSADFEKKMRLMYVKRSCLSQFQSSFKG